MTEQTKEGTREMATDEQLGKDIETLDQEAREALDRLADKREELAREHKATELAAERQREREEQCRQKEQREAREKEEARRREEAERLGEKRRVLEVRAEEEAAALVSTLEELLALDPVHVSAVAAAYGRVPEQRSSLTFPRVLLGWFIGRFKAVVPGIGFDSWEGNPPLRERDALTPGEARSQEEVGSAGAAEESRGG